MMQLIAAFNAGSSTLKFSFFQTTGLKRLYTGLLDQGTDPPTLCLKDSNDHVLFQERRKDLTDENIIPTLLYILKEKTPLSSLCCVGHRVVHGKDASGPVKITGNVLTDLQALIPLAPLHQPYALAVIKAVAAQYPHLPQVACFDTAFHRTQDAQETRLALPRSFYDQGIKRYGYHGLSYDYIASEALPSLMGAKKARERIIVAHLGSGASICALHYSKSVATTMGFSPLDGLMMGTRCGALDPGILLYMLTSLGMSTGKVESMLYHESGLLGVSGLSGDMRTLLKSSRSEAKEAINLFCLTAAKYISSLMVSLNGIDALVFTGGIGENAWPIRQAIVTHLTWAGLVLDEKRNHAQETTIHNDGKSAIPILRVPTHEDTIIARACKTLFKLP